MYLFCDHLIFLHNNNLVNIDLKGWDNLSDRCWLYTIVMDLVRNIYLINNIVTKLGSVSSSASFLYFFANHKNLFIDTIKNFADVVLPLTSLGHIETAPQFMAFCGIVSSVASVCQIMNPKLKL